MSEWRGLGAPEWRLEGGAKVTGGALFAADRSIPGALHAAFVRSPTPHGTIRTVDVAAARAMPGVVAVLTGADTRPLRLGRRLQDWPLLAWDSARFVGDRLAVVCAETARQALAAVAAVRVDLDELPYVADPVAALATGAPVIHPRPEDYHYIGGIRHPVPHPNIQGYRTHEHGDVDRAFAGASHVFEHEFHTPRVFHGYLEPRAAGAFVDSDRLRVLSTNKSPFRLREQLSASLGVPEEDLVVESGFIGGDFGGKGLSIEEFVVAHLTRLLRRPVRSVSSYADDMTATNTRHASRIVMRTALDDEGVIVGHEATVVLDGGAYAAAKPNAWLVPGEALLSMAGYRVPNARIEAMTVYTNNVPAGNARAPGQVQNAFAAESHMDLMAGELGLDPIEFRRRNAIRSGDTDVLGHEWVESSMTGVLDIIAAEYEARSGMARNVGVAFGARPSPAGRRDGSVVISVTEQGHVEILTGLPDQGGGAHTMLQRLAADGLGLPLERVAVLQGSTIDSPFDLGAGGSRVTPVLGGAVLSGVEIIRTALEMAGPAETVVEQLRRIAPRRFEVDFECPGGIYSTVGVLVEVDVDRETGAIQVLDAVLAADVGGIVNPTALRGQLVGGFVFGLGTALMEELITHDGRITNANLNEYKIPALPDVPPIRVVLAEHTGAGLVPRSAGELVNPCVAPAIANAVARAIGARVQELPISAEKVYQAARPPGAPSLGAEAPVSTKPSLELTHRFEVAAPPARVWELFQDVRLMASCLPGAELTSSEGDRHSGVVRVGIGPITARFEGSATVSTSRARFSGRIQGAGADRSGSHGIVDVSYRIGQASMGALVVIDTHLSLTGTAAQFGKPALVDEIGRRMIAGFARNLEAVLESPDESPAASRSARKVGGFRLLVASLWRVTLERIRRVFRRR